MSLIVAWLLFPAVMGLLSLGVGLLVDAASGERLPGALLLPVGFAGIVVACDLATLSGATARLCVPGVCVLAVAGYALALRRGARPRLARIDPWVAGAACAVFAIYAAPIVLSGSATFAGYASLDDTAQWFSLIDRVMEHGRNVAGLPPSTYKSLLQGYLGSGYPVGSMIPLGVGAKLTGQDVAWVMQPYFAFQAALLALCLWALLGPLVGSRRFRAFAVFVAAQPALLYGYALWGSIKEVVTAPLIPLLAVVVARALRAPPGVRALMPLVVVSAAVLAVLNVPGGVWLAPAVAPLLILAIRLRAEELVQRAAFFAGLLVILSLPTLATARTFKAAATGVLTSSSTGKVALGELTHPLSALQLLGIWPVGDFRNRPSPIWPTYLLLALVATLAVAGVAIAIRRRAFGIALYLTTCVAGCLIVRSGGSPWTTGKALATASPAFLAAAFAGTQALWRRPGAIAVGAAGLALAGGVLWSNALAYSGVRLAPRDQLAELEQIGERFSGQGPSMMTEFQPYGVRHFLRGLAVMQLPPKDLDALPLGTVSRYRTLVLDRSPLESRPPSSYRLVWAGRFYEVWQRVPGAVKVLARLGLGTGLQPAATPTCGQVRAIAATAARAHGRVAAVPRDPVLGFELGRVAHPISWSVDPSGGVYPGSGGAVEVTQAVQRPGRYGVWMGGFTPGTLTVTVDGRQIGSLEHRVELPGQYFEVAQIELARGDHQVVVRYSRPFLQPGSTSGVALLPMGPLVLSVATENLPVIDLTTANARSLCGRSLDWVEAVGKR